MGGTSKASEEKSWAGFGLAVVEVRTWGLALKQARVLPRDEWPGSGGASL